MTRLIAFVLLLLSTASVKASGGGGGAISVPRPGASDAFTITKSERGNLLRIDLEKRVLVIKDKKERELSLLIDSKTKFKPEDPKDYAGRKELKAAELQAGMSLKVVYRESDRTAVEVKVLKKE